MSTRCVSAVAAVVALICLAQAVSAEALGIKWKTAQEVRPERWEGKLVYPQFTGQSTLVTYANRTIETWAKEEMRQFVKETRKQRGTDGEQPAFFYDGKAVVSVARPDLISLYFQVDDYYGGAHGMNWFKPLNFASVGGKVRELALKDLFRSDVDACQAVSDAVIPRLREKGAFCVVNGDMEELSADEAEDFVITPSGLSFLFDPYEVGPYSQGAFIVKVPWSEFGDNLDTNGLLEPLLALE